MSLVRRIPLWFWWVLVIWLVCLPWPGMAPQADSGVQWVPFAGAADRPRDVIANVLLFLPFGYLFAVAHPRRGYALVVATAALISLTAESVQLLSPARYPSATDVVVNTAGAFLGAWFHRPQVTGQEIYSPPQPNAVPNRPKSVDMSH
jgi:glycopeptide antibiotics resistance protein